MDRVLKGPLNMVDGWISRLADIEILREGKPTENESGCAPGFSSSPILSNLATTIMGMYAPLASGNSVEQFCDQQCTG